MEVTFKDEQEAMSVVKRMVYLAYNAASVQGMGAFQAVDSASEEQVWDRAYAEGDYIRRRSEENEVYCDYVFGRMMKWGCKWEGAIVSLRDTTFRLDYQGFSYKYPTNEALLDAAVHSLGIDYKEGE